MRALQLVSDREVKSVDLQAPDVAIAEASIGAALVTAIFVIAIRRTRRHEE